MEFLDVNTYIIQQLPIILLTTTLAMFPLMVIFSIMQADGKEINFKKITISISLVFSFILIFSLLPTHERILKLKISKIKNEFVTKENAKLTTDRLLKIADKIECKYLGCDKTTKKENNNE